MIVIVDYKMGNLGSISHKIKKLGHSSVISSDISVIKKAKKIILPGIGSFEKAMKNIHEMNLIDILNEKVLVEQVPLLGICLGMQLVTEKSEEGNSKGLGWINGEVVKFKVKDSLKHKIPHIGWNQISIAKESLLMKGIPDLSEFYFVHSYYVKQGNQDDVLNETEFEYKFTSAIQKGNIFGVQYHPEKSHDTGALLLKNFINL
jgi:imidazole glycerol-phosphate synthase subunit HisH